MRKGIAVTALVTSACGRLHFDPLDRTEDAARDGAGTSIAFVQATPAAILTSADRAMVTLATAPAAGDLIVVYAWSYKTGGLTGFVQGSAVDDAGNGYTLAIERDTPANGCDSAGAAAIAIFYAPVTAAPAVITVTPTGTSGQQLGLVAAEYAGVGGIDEVTSKETAGSPASPLVFDSGTTGVTAADDELLAAVATQCAGVPDPVSWTDTAGFTVRQAATMTNLFQSGIAADRIVAARGAYADAWSVAFTGQASRPGFGAIATFK